MQNFSTTPRDTKPANALIINTLLFLVIEVWLMCAIRPLWQQQLSIFDSSSSHGVTGQSKPGHVGSSMQGHIIRDAKTPPFTHLRTIYMFQLSLPLMHVFGLCQDDDVDDGAYRYKCFSIVTKIKIFMISPAKTWTTVLLHFLVLYVIKEGGNIKVTKCKWKCCFFPRHRRREYKPWCKGVCWGRGLEHRQFIT